MKNERMYEIEENKIIDFRSMFMYPVETEKEEYEKDEPKRLGSKFET